MEGNVDHAYYDEHRRRETPHEVLKKGGGGHYFPPTDYKGKNVVGPIYHHPVREVVGEPGLHITCPDCQTTHDGMDHFKYNCARWQCRLRLAKGFAHCQATPGQPTLEQHHLNNEAINVMVTQGVTFERIAKQPKAYLPNEPLYDRNPLTGLWESTGIVPIDVWENLPPRLRLAPKPQDMSMEARQERAFDPGRRNAATLNAPRHIDDREFDKSHDIWYEAQCELKERMMPGYKALLVEYNRLKAANERLRSQIGSVKRAVQISYQQNLCTILVVSSVNRCFDPVGNQEFIPASAVVAHPSFNVNPAPDTAAKRGADSDIKDMQDME